MYYSTFSVAKPLLEEYPAKAMADSSKSFDNTTTYADSAAVPNDIPWSFAFGTPIPFSAPLCAALRPINEVEPQGGHI